MRQIQDGLKRKEEKKPAAPAKGKAGAKASNLPPQPRTPSPAKLIHLPDDPAGDT